MTYLQVYHRSYYLRCFLVLSPVRVVLVALFSWRRTLHSSDTIYHIKQLLIYLLKYNLINKLVSSFIIKSNLGSETCSCCVETMPAVSYLLTMVSNMSRVSEFYKLNITLVNIYTTKFLFKKQFRFTIRSFYNQTLTWLILT
jgi:hypothetical protein